MVYPTKPHPSSIPTLSVWVCHPHPARSFSLFLEIREPAPLSICLNGLVRSARTSGRMPTLLAEHVYADSIHLASSVDGNPNPPPLS